MDVFRNARQNFLRRQAETEDADVERQQGRDAALETGSGPAMQSQTAEPSRTVRPSPVSSVLRRFADLPRPSMPFSRQSGPRPTSSRYDDGSAIASPKTPQFATSMGIAMPPMPPHTSPHSRSHSRSQSQRSDITEPMPAVPAYHVSDSRRRRFDGADPAEMHLASMAEDGRRRRQRRQNSQEHNGGGRHRRRYILGDIGHRAPSAPGTPKTFMFCFPYVKSRRMRAQILRSLVSGGVLALILGIFLALLMTHNVYNSEFGVLLILVLLLAAAFFAHSIIKMVLSILHPPTAAEEEAAEEMYQRRRRAAAGVAGSGALGTMPSVYGPGGFSIPHEPIRVVLTRDEEAAGIESVAAKTQPPAYGLWRESVRVDPNRIYWQRNDEVPGMPPVAFPSSQSGRSGRSHRSSSSQSQSSLSTAAVSAPDSSTSSVASSTEPATERAQSPRPPSYMSDDGVQYVVEAQPRSIAPTTEVPLPHPAEAGRGGHPAEW
ncbi:hypothetical protein F503_00732 [Ophiostoma piceae UAMH 11346]|uniref:Uncharacterized protein n=1 Tax=Ophiostoma piceae (strain UAMH 11346) TaxID=1262450 RepID=S3C336_OPHP1|nr:hypothetical protein F503_00732 [Ophiostoma piceae UAMH 11346]